MALLPSKGTSQVWLQRSRLHVSWHSMRVPMPSKGATNGRVAEHTNLCGKSTETVESCNGNSRPQVLSVLAPPRRVPYFSPPKRCHPANMRTQCGNSVQTYHSCVHILCDSGSQCVWQRPVVQQKGCLSEILIGHKRIQLTNAYQFSSPTAFSNERRQWLRID